MHKIPKIIHYCWLSDEEFPPIVKKCMDSWQAHLSDFQFIKWDKSRFDVENHSWTKQAMKHGKFAFVSDYIRLHALFHYGGIYLDTDVEVLREFDESLLRNDIFMGFEHSGIPEAAIIGSKPHQDWIKSALNWYDINSFIRKNGSLNLTISPVILQNAFYNQFGLRLKERDTVQKFEGISVFPYQYFSPKNKVNRSYDIITETYTIHHFNAAWMEKGRIVSLKSKIHRLISKFFGRKHYLRILEIIRLAKSVLE